MAKIKLTAMVDAISGKLNGTVFSKNRGGAYIRSKSTVSNPQTPSQQNSRAVLTQFSQGWSQLTEPQRRSWIEAVDNFQRTDQFGDVRKLSGKNLYTSLNKNLATIGGSVLDVAPQPEQVGFCVIESNVLAYDIAGPAFDEAFLAGRFTVGERYVIVATPALTPGTNFVKNRIRRLGVIECTSDVGLELATFMDANYTPRFGVPQDQQVIYIGAYSINSVGQQTPISTIRGVIEYV